MLVLPELPLRISKQCREKQRQQVGKESCFFLSRNSRLIFAFFIELMAYEKRDRCDRNCFNCPICAAAMTVNTLDSEKSSLLHGPWIVACGYCNWTSLDIGIKFDKAQDFNSQIPKLKGRGAPSPSTKSPSHDGPRKDQPGPVDSEPSSDPKEMFTSLKSFYKSQLSALRVNNPLLTPAAELLNYQSPSNLARLMSMYAGVGSLAKKTDAKRQEMRESATQAEGFRLIDPLADSDAVQKLRTQGWTGTTSIAQQAEQTQPTRFIDELLPVPTLLQTKRGKRCGNCRHILVKPESKVTSTRFRIKLVAVNYIPKFSLEALRSPQQPAIDLESLNPYQANQFLLTMRNAIFDRVHVTLATPTRTPGPHGHKVTILCPEFDLEPNLDIWDEALKDNSRSDSYVDLNDLENPPSMDSGRSGGESRVAEAGKVWEKGRHWTTVVLEVVCEEITGRGKGEGDDDDQKRGLEEDEDLLEIPIFVRLEWMGDLGVDEAGIPGETVYSRGRTLTKRELAYWVVIGVGRVASR